MKLTSVYIDTVKFNETVDFYKIIFGIEPEVYCEDRWVEFNSENRLAIYNSVFDENNIKNKDSINKNYNESFINDFEKNNTIERKNNIIILNLYTTTLKDDYEKLKKLSIGEMSEIMYVNIVEPYYYFNIKDPNGNVLEINSEKY